MCGEVSKGAFPLTQKWNVFDSHYSGMHALVVLSSREILLYQLKMKVDWYLLNRDNINYLAVCSIMFKKHMYILEPKYNACVM